MHDFKEISVRERAFFGKGEEKKRLRRRVFGPRPPPVRYGTRIPGGNPTCPVWYENTSKKPHQSSLVQEYQKQTKPVWYGTRIPGGNSTCPIWYKNTSSKLNLSGMEQEYQQETTPV
ncbi:hypothetical protein DPMN_152118 [Dreissena polymorpha]|uniref:Uncharacterized protein n=1 Tax=Dreissena polymorpha TaxID=45954 RepID=A0A9D4FGM1_DREPO|nr:hypothetical protein DPMN_152118 [Dreissena polymorpha]